VPFFVGPTGGIPSGVEASDPCEKTLSATSQPWLLIDVSTGESELSQSIDLNPFDGCPGRQISYALAYRADEEVESLLGVERSSDLDAVSTPRAKTRQLDESLGGKVFYFDLIGSVSKQIQAKTLLKVCFTDSNLVCGQYLSRTGSLPYPDPDPLNPAPFT